MEAGGLADNLRRIAFVGDEGRIILELRPVAALADEGFVEKAFGDDDMRERGDDGSNWKWL